MLFDYVFPDDAPHVTIIDGRMGEQDVYFGDNNASCMLVDDDNLINTCSSSVNGYVNYNGGTTISFAAYSVGTYRINTTTYSLNIRSIEYSNLVGLSSYKYQSYQPFMLFVCAICLFLLLFRRFKR